MKIINNLPFNFKYIIIKTLNNISNQLVLWI